MRLLRHCRALWLGVVCDLGTDRPSYIHLHTYIQGDGPPRGGAAGGGRGDGGDPGGAGQVCQGMGVHMSIDVHLCMCGCHWKDENRFGGGSIE